jgi:hypothetical protein
VTAATLEAAHRERGDTAVTVELLHVPGCPHVEEARRLLMSCIRELGLENLRVEDKEGDFPSPSIIVSGRDVMGGTAAGAASCRLDRPTRERVLIALRQTSAAGG